MMSTPPPDAAVASTVPPWAASMTTAFPSAHAAKRNRDRSSYAMPRDPPHRFGHFAAMARDRRSITTLDPDHRWVNARPPAGSMTSDSGPPGTAIVATRVSLSRFGEMPKITMRSASGSVTHSYRVGASKQTYTGVAPELTRAVT